MISKFLFFIIIFLSLQLGTHSANIEWRIPGVSGRWEDPTNWRRVEDDAYVIPSEGDDVIISFDTNKDPYWMTQPFHVIISANTDEVYVQSLKIGGADKSTPCFRCDIPETDIYYWNSISQTYITDTIEDTQYDASCGVALIIEGPNRLNVKESFNAYWPGFLVMTGNKADPWAKSTLTADDPSYITYVKGAGKISAPLLTIKSAELKTISSFPNNIVPYKAGAQLEIEANLQIENIIFWGNGTETGEYSQIILSGDLISTDLYLLEERGPGFTDITPLIVFEDSVSNGNITVYLANSSKIDNPALVNQPIDIDLTWYFGYCTNVNNVANIGQGTEGGCSNVQEHDISVTVEPLPSCNSGNNCPGNPDCSNHGTCSNGICECSTGWRGIACQIADCVGIFDCNGHGTCISTPSGITPYCDCYEGWDTEDDCSIAVCPNNCSNHGECIDTVLPPTCVCELGWELGKERDCSEPTTQCPGENAECSGHGLCNSTTGTCTCDDGFEGVDCSLFICPTNSKGNGCSHHGTCTLVDGSPTCQCDEGWNGTSCNIAVCPNRCSGNGVCIDVFDPPRCFCSLPNMWGTGSSPSSIGGAGSDSLDAFTGEACDIQETNCATSRCSEHGSCGNSTKLFPGACLINNCDQGYKGWDCSFRYCEGTGNMECQGHGQCVDNGSNPPSCECREGFVLGPFGDCKQAECEVNGCSGHGTCRIDLATPRCECDAFYYGDDCSIKDCPADCNSATNNGECTEEGCVCSDLFAGADCSLALCPPFDIVTKGNCNLHGTCNSDTHQCTCLQGWGGIACDEPCPQGCGKRGSCDILASPPVCVCEKGWKGSSCDKHSGDGQDNEKDSLYYLFFTILFPVALCCALLLLLGCVVCIIIMTLPAALNGIYLRKTSISNLSAINFTEEEAYSEEL